MCRSICCVSLFSARSVYKLDQLCLGDVHSSCARSVGIAFRQEFKTKEQGRKVKKREIILQRRILICFIVFLKQERKLGPGNDTVDTVVRVMMINSILSLTFIFYLERLKPCIVKPFTTKQYFTTSQLYIYQLNGFFPPTQNLGHVLIQKLFHHQRLSPNIFASGGKYNRISKITVKLGSMLRMLTFTVHIRMISGKIYGSVEKGQL